MEETIISVNGANIITVALMIILIFAALYFISMIVAKMRGGAND